ncbi:MAG: hypothetical protein GXP32_02030 [Kiritimatiellaeota bacterium]|nr:hypothetical protein [Kiritimatiellota bacterium]
MKFSVLRAFASICMPLFAVTFSFQTSAGDNTDFKPFVFAVLGDCRPERSHSLTQPSIFPVMLKEIDKSPAEFVVMTGDMISGYIDDPKKIDEQWAVFKKACAVLRKPLRLVPGNHDIWNAVSLELYKKRCGEPYYDFTVNGCEFIVLDSEDLRHPAKIAGARLEWLKERLEASKHLKYRFVFIHQPLWHDEKSGWNATVHPLLVKYRIDTVFAGHEHRFADEGRSDGVRYIITGGGGAPLRGGRGIGAYYHYLLAGPTADGVSIKVVEPNSSESKVPQAFAGDQLTRILNSLDYKVPAIYPGEAAKLAIRLKLLNTYDSPLTFHLKLVSPKGSNWTTSDPIVDVTVDPGKSKGVALPIEYGGKNLFPLPKLLTSLEINNLKIYDRTAELNVRFKRRLTIKNAKGRIRIDGKLDEADWKNAPPAGHWFNLTTKHWSEENVELKALRNGRNLFLAFKCQSDKPSSLRKMIHKKDWYIPIEDSVLFVFHSRKLKNSKFVFGISSHGVQSDYLASNKTVGFKWSPKWESAVVRGKDGYVVELALPMSIFEDKPLETLGLRFNAGRMSVSKGRRIYCWCLPLGRINDSRGFGECVFPDGE